VIKYALACAAGHPFEGWFGSSTDYDDQSARGQHIDGRLPSALVGDVLHLHRRILI